MYVKLAFRNARKYLKEYLIYVITVTLCVAMFYAFMSVCSNFYVSRLPIQYDMDIMKRNMSVPVIIITLLITFLIQYANRYVLKRKQKELAIQTLLGIEQKYVAYLFYLETLICGLIAIGFGILLGSIFAQFLTAYIMNFYGEPYHIFFALYPDTILITVLVFLLIYTGMGWMNIRSIRSMKIVELLKAEKQQMGDMKKEVLMPIMMLSYSVVSIVLIRFSWDVYQRYGSISSWSDRIILGCNVVLPALFLMVVIGKLLLSIRRRRFFPMQGALLITSILSLMMMITTLLVVTGHPKIDATTSNKCYIFTILSVVYLIFTFFYSLSYGMMIFSEQSKQWKFQNNHLFLLRQITSKLTVTSRTMSLLASCIMVAITIFTIGPILTGWVLGYLDFRAVYDIQMNSEYNSRTTLDTLPDGEFSYVDDSCKKLGVPYQDNALVEIYFMQRSDFEQTRGMYVDPMMVMGLSDYNKLRTMAGFEPIQLGEDEYTAHWYYTADDELMNDYLMVNPTIQIGENVLTQAKECRYQEKMGEVIFSFDTYGVLIVPDQACSGLLMGRCNYYVKFKEPLAYQDAVNLYDTIANQVRDKNIDPKFMTEIRMKSIQRNEGISVGLTMTLLFVYSAFMLLIICFTILSLQQLEDSTDYRQRFDVVRRLGVSETSIQKIILWQMGIWFVLPLLVGGICGRVIGQFYFDWSLKYLSAYVDSHELRIAVAESIGIIVILLVCYFIATWSMFRRNMRKV